MTPDPLARGRHVLFTMLTALEYRYPPGHEPALIAALPAWLHGWPGIGRIVAGMSRQGHDLQLVRHGAEGCRATFYPAGRAHSQTAAVGSAETGSRGWRCSGRRGRGSGGGRARRGDGPYAAVWRQRPCAHDALAPAVTVRAGYYSRPMIWKDNYEAPAHIPLTRPQLEAWLRQIGGSLQHRGDNIYIIAER